MRRVGPVAFVLGFAGLLPQLLAVGLVFAGHGEGGIDKGIAHGIGQAIAFGYGSLILSFLGGMWWGFAMRREAGRREAGQGRLVAIAVVPSLVPVLLASVALGAGQPGWALVGLGSAVLLTLPVDRHLVATGEAPANWMRLRVPLSVGLGVLTIVAGAVSQGAVTRF